MGGMREIVHTIHDQVDVRAGLAARGQRRTVHHLKSAADEGIAEFLIALRIEVAHAFENAPAHPLAVQNAQGVVLDPAHPAVGGGSKRPGGFWVNFKKPGINVVKIHIQCAEHFIKTSKTCHSILYKIKVEAKKRSIFSVPRQGKIFAGPCLLFNCAPT